MLKFRLLAAAYAPLMLLLAIRLDAPYLRLACATLFLGGLVSLYLLIEARRRLTDQPFRIAEVADEGNQIAGYLATYLLPFLTISEPRLQDVVAYVGFMALVGLVLVRADLLQVQPLLYLFGYRVLRVRTASGWVGFLVCQRMPARGDQYQAVVIKEGLMLATVWIEEQ